MKNSKRLIAILAAYSLVALLMLWLSSDDPRLVNLLVAIAAVLSIPIAGLMSLLVMQLSAKTDEVGSISLPANRCPILVVGNGSSDVNVMVGPEGVNVTVGGPLIGGKPDTADCRDAG